MSSFDFSQIPFDVRETLFENLNPGDAARISRDDAAAINDRANHCFATLAGPDSKVPPPLKSMISRIDQPLEVWSKLDFSIEH